MPIETGELAVGDRILLLVFKDKDFRFSVDGDEAPPEMAWRMATVIEKIVPRDPSFESMFRAKADDGQTVIIEREQRRWRWSKN